MFRNKFFVIAVTLLVVIALLTLTLDAEASCATYWWRALYYYACYLTALDEYGPNHSITQSHYSSYLYYWNLYMENCGGG